MSVENPEKETPSVFIPPFDVHSNYAVNLRDWLEAELEEERFRLESRGLSSSESDFSRGKIDLLKFLLMDHDPEKEPEINGEGIEYS